MNNQQLLDWCQAHAKPSLKKSIKKTLIIGILNVTPDSFSDGGKYLNIDSALKQVEKMQREGADLIDIGGESSRPGAESVTLDEELGRVIPLIERIRAESDTCISIDTTKAEVMRSAISAGAGLINDISALKDRISLKLAAECQIPVCLMHMKGNPLTMQACPQYENEVVSDINDFFQKRIEICLAAGIKREHMILDPGFGFGKSVRHNLKIVKDFYHFKQHGLPVMLGVSRKSTLGTLLNTGVHERLIGGIALTVIAALQGLNLIRTHDVLETKQALCMAHAVMQTEHEDEGGDTIYGA